MLDTSLPDYERSESPALSEATWIRLCVRRRHVASQTRGMATRVSRYFSRGIVHGMVGDDRHDWLLIPLSDEADGDDPEGEMQAELNADVT
ncbi:hypothetical protein NQZ68_016898 [Dissostichus eleginoides]|nr:hypothetical protein NQZ68_016898 [Dissostichus eleginoides]